MKQVCENRKKEADNIRQILLVGNEKLLNPGTRPFPWKCKNCRRLLASNDKIFLLEDGDNK